MNDSPNNAFLSEGRLRTNSSWWLTSFIEQCAGQEPYRKRLRLRIEKWLSEQEESGFQFPENARACHKLIKNYSWRNELPSPPRVVGLLVEGNHLGLVNPLITRRSDFGWQVSQTYLPFRPGQLQDSLIQVLSEAGFSLDQVVPELIGFSITEQLNEPCSGDSMHIAGLLSVIDAINGQACPTFEKACSIVMPKKDRLVPVNSIDLKLQAFAREHGEASLLVAPKGFEVPESLQAFFPDDNVWRVADFGELADL